jgi:hypothetical protein
MSVRAPHPASMAAVCRRKSAAAALRQHLTLQDLTVRFGRPSPSLQFMLASIQHKARIGTNWYEFVGNRWLCCWQLLLMVRHTGRCLRVAQVEEHLLPGRHGNGCVTTVTGAWLKVRRVPRSAAHPCPHASRLAGRHPAESAACASCSDLAPCCAGVCGPAAHACNNEAQRLSLLSGPDVPVRMSAFCCVCCSMLTSQRPREEAHMPYVFLKG